jgi:type IV secretory pathway component VirB8
VSDVAANDLGIAVTRPLTAEEKEIFYEPIRGLEREARARRRGAGMLGYIVGAAGCLVGVGGIWAAAVQYSTPPAPPVFIAVDQSTGWVGEPISIKEAPTLFNETVQQRDLRGLLEACVSYTADTLRLTWARCMAHLSPEMQQQYATAMGEKNPNAPRNVLGRKGSAYLESSFRFARQPSPPDRPDIYAYTVRFIRTTIMGGLTPVTEPWVADIVFEYHPDWPMSPDVRTFNPDGMVVIGFHAEKDKP